MHGTSVKKKLRKFSNAQTYGDCGELTRKSRKLGNMFVTCKAKGIGSYNQKGPNVHINKYILIEKASWPAPRHAEQDCTYTHPSGSS